MTADEFMLDLATNRDISCICYFGGSPEPSLPFAIQVSREVRRSFKDRIIRICFEWNGCGNSKLVERAVELSLESGGNIKFDIKCFDENLNKVLSGTSNARAYENFKLIAEKFYDERTDLPVLTATTLLVPGYVDELEVERIANFIADLNPDIPYGLLIFYPQFIVTDLPVTPVEHVLSCYQVARKALRKVHVGNLHLIGLRSMSDLERVAAKSTK
jgi:pyruvate formate lyase activating enzyme